MRRKRTIRILKRRKPFLPLLQPLSLPERNLLPVSPPSTIEQGTSTRRHQLRSPISNVSYSVLPTLLTSGFSTSHSLSVSLNSTKLGRSPRGPSQRSASERRARSSTFGSLYSIWKTPTETIRHSRTLSRTPLKPTMPRLFTSN